VIGERDTPTNASDPELLIKFGGDMLQMIDELLPVLRDARSREDVAVIGIQVLSHIRQTGWEIPFDASGETVVDLWAERRQA
jgi:hypothetical protein